MPDNTMTELRFPYKPKVVVYLLSTLLFVAFALGLGKFALTNDRGLILNGIVEFSTTGATIFYWSLAAASCLFVLIGLMALYSGMTMRREIVLTEGAIKTPKSGISKKTITVKFSDISDMYIQSVQKHRFLVIGHQDGKLTIPQTMLESKQAFEELIGLMAERVEV